MAALSPRLALTEVSRGTVPDMDASVPGTGPSTALLLAVKGTVDAALASRFAVRGSLFVVPAQNGATFAAMNVKADNRKRMKI